MQASTGAVLALLFVSAPALAGIVEVSPTGATAATIQAVFDRNPPDTQFVFGPGTYALSALISLNDGQRAVCRISRSCVISGNNMYKVGINGGDWGNKNQRIQGFVVRDSIAHGSFPVGCIAIRDAGVIEDNEVLGCEVGLQVNANQIVRRNHVHHNTRLGIAGGPGDNILIEDNEVDHNNTGRFDPNDDAGGSKIVGSEAGTRNLVWRGNRVHDNYGQGIWSDGNVYAIYEDNIVTGNLGAGIDHEISWNATIRRNTLSNNMLFELHKGLSCAHGAQIVVTNSRYVDIYENMVDAIGANGICLYNSATRKQAPWFPQFLSDVRVFHNTIRMRGTVVSGYEGDVVPSNIAFYDNTYYTESGSPARWAAMRSYITKAVWQTAGHDKLGKFLTW